MAKCSICGKDIGFSYYMVDGKRLCDKCNAKYKPEAKDSAPAINLGSKDTWCKILLVVGIVLLIAGVAGLFLISQSDFGVQFSDLVLDIGAGLGATAEMSAGERIAFTVMRNRYNFLIVGAVCILISYVIKRFK